MKLTALGLVALGVAQSLAVAQPALAVSYDKRGVHFFEAAVPCPLAGVGSRGERGCNRLVLDDDATSAELTGGQLVLRNRASYAKKTLIGDVILSGRSASGLPVAAHLRVFKKGQRFVTELHAHVPPRDGPRLAGTEIAPFEVSVDDGNGPRPVLVPAQLAKALRARRLMSRLVTVRPAADSVAGDLLDVTVGAGAGGLSKGLLRARFSAPGTTKDLRQALLGSDWSFSLTSLSTLLPQEDARRDQFVHGLAGVALLNDVGEKGLAKGQTLTLAMKGGKGSVALDGHQQAIANAADVVRSILELNSVGMILLAHAGQP